MEINLMHQLTRSRLCNNGISVTHDPKKNQTLTLISMGKILTSNETKLGMNQIMERDADYLYY